MIADVTSNKFHLVVLHLSYLVVARRYFFGIIKTITRSLIMLNPLMEN